MQSLLTKDILVNFRVSGDGPFRRENGMMLARPCIRRCLIPSTSPTQLHVSFFPKFLGNVSAIKINQTSTCQKYLLREIGRRSPRKPKLTRSEAQNFVMGAL
jgi:hypothetical protein